MRVNRYVKGITKRSFNLSMSISPESNKGGGGLPAATTRRDLSRDVPWEDLDLPMTPAAAIRMFGFRLTEFEFSEILQYKEVFCLGAKAKKQKTDLSGKNFGFDDENDDYIILPNDHFAYRYEVCDTLGKGSFGQVVRCYDYKTKTYIALKVLKNRSKYHKQGAIEVEILELLR